jgi:peptidyl-tRNA hydrolase
MDVADWVLSQFTQSECDAIDPILDRAREATELLIAGNAKKAMNLFNTTPKSDVGEGK